ncbi:MAG: hypothetical protein II008_03130 [Oscillospiraceae bacterium]|nr:hypothetical protein [Oscillospiraceae bacterium]
MRRKKELFDGLLALVAMIAFAVCFLGASMLVNENPKGWALCAVALVLAVPVVILTNREEKA